MQTLLVAGLGFISTHAPLAGRDLFFCKNYSAQVLFQPTRPLRGATETPTLSKRITNISTHAPLAGRDPDQFDSLRDELLISTHAPLAGRDVVSLPIAPVLL